jgi:transcriptional regulator with XRE-family HTH domain
LLQEELADLVSVSQTAISRIERGSSSADLETALGLQVVFGRSPRALFPDLYRKVEEQVMRKATKLDRALARRTDADSGKKRQLLEDMTERAAPRPA